MCFKMKMPAMPTVQQTGRDILPSYETKDPDSAKFGDGDDDFTNIAKRKGKSSLRISKDSSGTDSLNSGVNYNL